MVDKVTSVVAKVVVAIQPTTKIGKPRKVKVLYPRPIVGVKYGIIGQ